MAGQIEARRVADEAGEVAQPDHSMFYGAGKEPAVQREPPNRLESDSEMISCVILLLLVVVVFYF